MKANLAQRASSSFHVLIHLGGNDSGGVRQVSEAWFRGFTERGVRVSYLCNQEGRYSRELRENNRDLYVCELDEIRSVSRRIAGYRLPDLGGWLKSYGAVQRGRSRVKELLRRLSPDVVLGNGVGSVAVLGSVCKECGVDIVPCFHGVSHPADFLALRRRIIVHLLNRYCREVVGVSRITLERFCPYLKIPSSVIYNSVSPVVRSDASRARLRSEWGATDSTVVFGTAARITPVKAIDLFVTAAQQLIESHPNLDILFVFAGAVKSASDQQYLQQILASVKKAGLERRIQYTGFQPISDLYSAIDVFCHTRKAKDVEALGLTIIEALSIGLPVIVCDRGGFNEFLPGDTGVRYNPSAAGNLTEAMEGMLVPAFRLEQGKRGQNFYRDEYPDFSLWVDKWLETLKDGSRKGS